MLDAKASNVGSAFGLEYFLDMFTESRILLMHPKQRLQYLFRAYKYCYTFRLCCMEDSEKWMKTPSKEQIRLCFAIKTLWPILTHAKESFTFNTIYSLHTVRMVIVSRRTTKYRMNKWLKYRSSPWLLETLPAIWCNLLLKCLFCKYAYHAFLLF